MTGRRLRYSSCETRRGNLVRAATDNSVTETGRATIARSLRCICIYLLTPLVSLRNRLWSALNGVSDRESCTNRQPLIEARHDDEPVEMIPILDTPPIVLRDHISAMLHELKTLLRLHRRPKAFTGLYRRSSWRFGTPILSLSHSFGKIDFCPPPTLPIFQVRKSINEFNLWRRPLCTPFLGNIRLRFYPA